MHTDLTPPGSDSTEHGQSPPLVSIVIPCFNYGRFLAEAIESALGQTYHPIEVIVVDDGSTDDTSAVARRYPVQLIRQANAGLSAASNVGIRASKGQFAMRLDADDILASNFVDETLAVLLANRDAHFVYTELEYFGACTGTYDVEPFNPATIIERNYVHATALMRRTSFEQVGGYRPNPRRVRCEDWDLWLTFIELGMSGVLVPKPLLLYRQHERGSMVTLNVLSLTGFYRALAMTAFLQDSHPATYCAPLLRKKLRGLPGRLRARSVSMRFAFLLTGFYGVMLLRETLGLGPKRQPKSAGTLSGPARR